MARVMCVGIATLDIVNRVAHYPEEDTEVRALGQSQRLGGNAANTATVLAQLGAEAYWVGNLAEAAQIVEQGFARYGVDTSLAVRVPDAVMPTSYILLSEANGSRSIVHFRDLPEYRAGDFCALDLAGFDWVHFEGRAVDQLSGMIGHARDFGGLSISLEAEKPRPGIEALFAQVDLLMISRDYVLAKGLADAQAALRSLPAGSRGSCTWGAQGAWAIEDDGRLLHAAAPSLPRVVDTIGAGDVFNATMVHALGSGQPLEQALPAAVGLASAQCARQGLELGDRS